MIEENLHEVGDLVFSHQCQPETRLHRLVLCNYPPPQEAGEWVPFNVPAKVAGWAYDIKCGKLFNCTN